MGRPEPSPPSALAWIESRNLHRHRHRRRRGSIPSPPVLSSSRVINIQAKSSARIQLISQRAQGISVRGKKRVKSSERSMWPRPREVTLHPPALDAGDEEGEEIPWVLLEDQAYVADRRNATTAFSDCRGYEGLIQASLFVARPPRLSYICVFYRRGFQIGEEPLQQQQQQQAEEGEQMILITPYVIATDEGHVLLHIVVGDRGDMYIYQPGGECGPLLTRLQRPPYSYRFNTSDIGLVSCCPPQQDQDHDNSSSSSYMVAALCPTDELITRSMRGQFILYLYDSKLQAWTTTTVSVEDQAFQKYQQEGYFVHFNTKVIAAGGEHATIAFVDLSRGILLCDLSQVKDKPLLRYVPLPHRQPGLASLDEPRFSRDIAVVDGHFKYVRQLFSSRPCSFSGDHSICVGWTCEMFTRPVFLDGNWVPVCSMDSSKMDIQESSPDLRLLPRLEDDEFKVLRPMLSLDRDDNTICFMVWNHFMVWNEGKAWVMAVDMKNNRLRGLSQFDPTRYRTVDIAYHHSRISRYLKRPAQGSSSKKVPWWGGEGEVEGMVEGGGDLPLV